MQRKMSVPPVSGKSPGEKFGKPLTAVVSVPPERALEIRQHTPKKRGGKADTGADGRPLSAGHQAKVGQASPRNGLTPH